MLGVAIVSVPRFVGDRGSLVVLEEGKFLPFEVRRVFFMWGMPAAAVRAEDAISCHEALIAVQGGVTLDLDNGQEQLSVRLSQPDQALCMHAGVWVRMRDFSPDAIVLAAASLKHEDTVRFTAPQPLLLERDSIKLWPSGSAV